MKNILLKLSVCILTLTGAIDIMAQNQEVRVFAHRGGRLEHDENTLPALQASYNTGFRGFEVDIRYTKDGAMVVTHDSSLDRTTNGTGIVEKKTEAEIRQLVTKEGNKILFLDELLDFLDGKKELYVEFEMKTTPEKYYPQERLEEFCDKLYKAVTARRPADALYVFTSSDTRGLRYLQSHYRGVDLLLITPKPCNDETIDLCKAMGIKRLGATMDGTSRKAIKRAHDEGIIVSLWPGNSIEDFMLGAYLGADFLCTDVPVAVKTWAEKNAPWIKVKY